ncbi:MAG: radical SAM family heme chaperone HemW [Magnetococcales bacterium]|nr:radical SAM family heme chaperone HemW [Magnetococcales bacterium]
MAYPLGLYLHIPFCSRKCFYCDFTSIATPAPPEQVYVAALLRELVLWRERLAFDSRPLLTVYFGGGTPSLLSAASVANIMATIRSLWTLPPEAEVTLEANPDSVTPFRLAGYRAAGINRLSLGIQAFSPDRLALLGRIHTVAAARAAIHAARAAGFTNLSLDLIYATPGQTLMAWQEELAEAMAWHPEHLSCYSLTLEPGTPLADSHGAEMPAEELALEMFLITRDMLARRGWQPYEISNFAQPGQFSRHNCHYWEFGDYIGAGVAAHGKLTSIAATNLQIRRTRNHGSVTSYVESLREGRLPLDLDVLLSRDEAAADALVMGLRQSMGLDRRRYRVLKGVDIVVEKGTCLAPMREAGWIDYGSERIFLTPQGVCIADSIMAELL